MTTHTIIEDGIDSSITEEQARDLLAADAIYECPECEPLPSEHVYHVSPSGTFENDYERAAGVFAFLA